MDDSTTFLKVMVGVLVTILIVIGASWAFRSTQYSQDSVFAGREEELRRKTFEKSKAYLDGLDQELQRMQYEYVQADEKQKMALGSIILHRVAGVDVSQLPTDTQQFIQKLKTERGLK
jgi:uncharacterized damage-inducible protein DinB